MRIAVEDEKAIVMEGAYDSGVEEVVVVVDGDGDGVALEFAGKVAEGGGIEGVAEFLAE